MTWFNRQTDEQRHAQVALAATVAEYGQLSRKIDAQLAECRRVGLDVEIRFDIEDPCTFEYRDGRVTQVLK